MNLYKKLEEAKYKFHQLEIKKTGKNTFAKYDYLQLQDFIKPIVEIMHEYKLLSYVSFTSEVATLTVLDTETEDGHTLEVTSPMSTAALKGCHEVQNLDAVQTYIRRYLYNALFDIVEGDAIDGSEPLKPTNIKCTDLINVGHKKGYNAKAIETSLVNAYGRGMEYITQAEHDETLAKLTALPDKE